MHRLSIFAATILTSFILTSCQDSSKSSVPQFMESAIVGGSFAQVGEFPFAVNIWSNDSDENYIAHLCGGSLIAPKWVLTAAHCVLEDASETQKRVVSANKLKAYIGGILHSGQDGQLLRIQSVRVHPDFKWPKNDFALLELAEAVNSISPILLNDIDLSESTENVNIVGWGLSDNTGAVESSILKILEAPLLPVASCSQDSFPMARGFDLGKETLCIQTYHHQKASCPGDSGGPLFLKRNNLFVQVGVVSWGSACSGNRSKDSSAVGYAAVSAALPWIQKTIQNTINY